MASAGRPRLPGRPAVVQPLFAWHFTPEAKEEIVVNYIALAGRICFAAMFIFAAPGHFTAAYVGYAAQAGVPAARLLVPLSGLIPPLRGPPLLPVSHAKLPPPLPAVFLTPRPSP